MFSSRSHPQQAALNSRVRNPFHLSAPQGHLIEIKRLDQAADAPKDRIYQWLWIDDDAVTSLRFQGMTTTPRLERSFAEASLWIDDARGELRWTRGATVALHVRSREDLPRHVQVRVHEHRN